MLAWYVLSDTFINLKYTTGHATVGSPHPSVMSVNLVGRCILYICRDQKEIWVVMTPFFGITLCPGCIFHLILFIRARIVKALGCGLPIVGRLICKIGVKRMMKILCISFYMTWKNVTLVLKYFWLVYKGFIKQVILTTLNLCHLVTCKSTFPVWY